MIVKVESSGNLGGSISSSTTSSGSRMTRLDKYREARRLYNEGYTYREIAQRLRMSFRDIAKAIQTDPIEELRREIEERLDSIGVSAMMARELATKLNEEFRKTISELKNNEAWEHKKIMSHINELYNVFFETATYKANKCRRVDNEGFCTAWMWDSTPDWIINKEVNEYTKYTRKGEDGKIRLNVHKYPLVCLGCDIFVIDKLTPPEEEEEEKKPKVEVWTLEKVVERWEKERKKKS